MDLWVHSLISSFIQLICIKSYYVLAILASIKDNDEINRTDYWLGETNNKPVDKHTR